jgi:hypothetical protein
VQVDIDWNAGAVTEARLTARESKTVRVRIGTNVTEHRLRAGVATVAK